MHTTKHFRRRAVTWATAGLAAAAAASALSLTAASAAPVASAQTSGPFTFSLVPSTGIKSCLPHAGGQVTIVPGTQNDTMHVSISGMPRNSEFDLFVIEQPNKPFGVSWYQADVNADSHGFGQATVRGIFDAETFSVWPAAPPRSARPTSTTSGCGSTIPTCLKAWAASPTGRGTQPIVTPFNGEQLAGIQALNTAQFPVAAGPLSRVHR